MCRQRGNQQQHAGSDKAAFHPQSHAAMDGEHMDVRRHGR